MNIKLSHLNDFITTNDNPNIWVKNDKKSYSMGITPTNVYVNNNGDIILEVSMNYVIQRDEIEDLKEKWWKK